MSETITDMVGEQDESSWLRGLAEIGGGFDLGWLRFDSRINEPIGGYDHEILIRADLLEPSSDCFPNDNDRVTLEAMEDEISGSAADNAVLAGVLTEGGTRTFVLYGNNRVDWLDTWKRGRSDARERRIIFTVVEDPEWPTHKALFPLAIAANANSQILGYLLEQGAQLNLERHIDWTICFPNEESALAAKAKLSNPFSAEISKSKNETQDFCLAASLTAVVTAEFIARMDARMRAFAKTCGGRYDGWGAEIQP
jgi:hypothetical protein